MSDLSLQTSSPPPKQHIHEQESHDDALLHPESPAPEVVMTVRKEAPEQLQARVPHRAIQLRASQLPNQASGWSGPLRAKRRAAQEQKDQPPPPPANV